MKKFLMTLAMAYSVSGCAATSVTVASAERVPAAALEVQTFTANDAGFAVNSHLILGEKEAVLVDGQFTRSQAKNVAAMIRKSGRRLTTIFITHGHPDHYFGLEVLLKAFPRARAVATPDVLKDIEATAEAKLAYWKPMYKDELPNQITLPEVTNAKELTVDGQPLQILSIGPGESEHLAMLYAPSTGALFTGDLAYSNVHLWLAENRPQAWLKNLAAAQRLKLSAVYPGHGEGHAVAILNEDRRYIETFLQVTQPPTDKATALKALEARYPKYRLPVIAELSVGARVQ